MGTMSHSDFKCPTGLPPSEKVREKYFLLRGKSGLRVCQTGKVSREFSDP